MGKISKEYQLSKRKFKFEIHLEGQGEMTEGYQDNHHVNIFVSNRWRIVWNPQKVTHTRPHMSRLTDRHRVRQYPFGQSGRGVKN